MNMDTTLEDFDKLSREEQRAWLGFFAGASGYVTKYGDEWHPSFGKYECEQVDFESVWLGKFVDLGWLTITEHRRFKALGMPGQPDSVEYRMRSTEKGFDVRESYWERLNTQPQEEPSKEERNFRWAYALLVELAKVCLDKANTEAEPGAWPAGQEWDDLSGTSKSVFLHQARDMAGIPHEEFLAGIRAGEYEVDDLFDKPEPSPPHEGV